MAVWAVIILFALIMASNIVCFWIGAKIGQVTSKGETIQAPVINPLERIRQAQERREAAREADRLETIMQNIDRYDGTSQGQQDVPRG